METLMFNLQFWEYLEETVGVCLAVLFEHLGHFKSNLPQQIKIYPKESTASGKVLVESVAVALHRERVHFVLAPAAATMAANCILTDEQHEAVNQGVPELEEGSNRWTRYFKHSMMMFNQIQSYWSCSVKRNWNIYLHREVFPALKNKAKKTQLLRCCKI